jgi:hypothetical protein
MLPVVGKVVLITVSNDGRYGSSTDKHGTDAQHAAAVPSHILHYMKECRMTLCHSLSASHIRAMPDVRFEGAGHAIVK